jgi:hypothetical protein
MKMSLANERLGFWAECGFIDLDKGNMWPRQYMWRCGCMGVSFDGEVVLVAPCRKHPEFIDLLPDGMFDVDDLRSQLESRVRPFERFKDSGRRGADGITTGDRAALIDIFDKGKTHGRAKNKRQDRPGTPRGVPDSGHSEKEG